VDGHASTVDRENALAAHAGQGQAAREPHTGLQSAVRFSSILVPSDRGAEPPQSADPPDFFHDLNLDQIVAAITAEWKDYDLAPFFHTPLHEIDAINYRQEVFLDLEQAPLFDSVKAFSGAMRDMGQHLTPARERCHPREQQRWFLDAVEIYVEGVRSFGDAVRGLPIRSRGLAAFRDYLSRYLASSAFNSLANDAREVRAALAAIRYCILIHDSGVTVRTYEGEADYSAAVEATFAKFRRGNVKDYRVKFGVPSGLNHIEAQIVDRVALLFPEPFKALETFSERHSDFLEPTIARFDREIQFYVAYRAFMRRIAVGGLGFCYPRIRRDSKAVRSRAGFDLALATRLIAENMPVVTNDFDLKGDERIMVVSGPNNGGKTTFARTFGQLHYLASLGCPVAGTEAQLFLFDRLFTHFEREEDIANLRGKLEDDLFRIRQILDQATSDSVIVMNEIFASTTLNDAVYLGTKVMERISQLDLLAVCVTFLDELASFGRKTVSIVSLIDPADPSVRTYKLARKPADGLAYALAIAQKYHVTYDQLRERIKR
jgi:DNA mismatch repair protein MutS